MAKPVESSRVALDVLDDLDAVLLEQRPGRLGAEADRLERVEVDHRHLALATDRVDDRLRGGLAEEAVVRRDVDEGRLHDAAGVETEDRHAGRGGVGEAFAELLGRAEGDDDGIDALGDGGRDLAVDRGVVAVRVDHRRRVAARLGLGLEEVDRLLGRGLGGVVRRDDGDRPGLGRPTPALR